MGINIFLMLIIVLLIVLLAYLQKLHYDEIKGLYGKLGITIETKEEVKPSRIKNHIKKRMEQMEQGGD